MDLYTPEEALLAGGGPGGVEGAPAWVRDAARRGALLARAAVAAALCAAYAGGWCYAAYATASAVDAAGLAKGWCAWRASAWLVCVGLFTFGDFAIMLWLVPRGFSRALPAPWHASAAAAEALRRSMEQLPGNIVGSFVLQLVPLGLWVRNAEVKLVAALVLLATLTVMHQVVNVYVFVYMGVYTEGAQRRFEETLLRRGGLSYDDTVEEYAAVNDTRKALASALKGASTITYMFLFAQALLIYDFELRPWAGWSLGLCFLCNALALAFYMQPLIGLNDWPEELTRGVMESRSLSWGAAERSHFCAHVAATTVKVQYANYEMTHGARKAIMLAFFGWWLFVTELRQFHEYDGFEFDKQCIGNATHRGHESVGAP